MSLAILGGGPEFGEPLHVGRPSLGDRGGFLARVDAMLDRRRFSNDGPLVQELEARVAAYLGVPHFVATENGTSALRLMVRACGLEGEVLVPSFTFVATAHALLWEGLTPIFCDIDPESLTLDPSACAAAITPATRAIMGVHVFGRTCLVEELGALAARHGLELLFDAAHGFGCDRKGVRVGGFGRAEAFSFHATKIFHTFEGGGVATRDGELASRLRSMRNFGFVGYDRVESLGINAKMPEVCAAMGLANLSVLEATLAATRATWEAYRAGLDGIPGLSLRSLGPDRESHGHYVIVEIDEPGFGLHRDQLLATLAADGILARRYFYPGVHAMEPYRTRWPEAGARLPRTDAVVARVLALPAGAELGTDRVERVCRQIREAQARAGEVRGHLARSGGAISPP